MMGPDLNALRLFAVVARHRNFRRAAVELNLSPSTLSERIRDLESGLGFRLLNRTTRSVAPTDAGRRLLDRLVPALSDIHEAVAATGGLGAPFPARCASTGRARRSSSSWRRS